MFCAPTLQAEGPAVFDCRHVIDDELDRPSLHTSGLMDLLNPYLMPYYGIASRPRFLVCACPCAGCDSLTSPGGIGCNGMLVPVI